MLYDFMPSRLSFQMYLLLLKLLEICENDIDPTLIFMEKLNTLNFDS